MVMRVSLDIESAVLIALVNFWRRTRRHLNHEKKEMSERSNYRK